MKPAPTFGRRGAAAGAPLAPAPRAAAQTAPSITMASLLAGRDDDDAPLPGQPQRVDGRPVAHGEIEMMRAIGPNWPAYRDTWIAMRDAPSLRPGFSFAAFFGQGVWLLYRKQYAIFFGLVALSVAGAFALPAPVGRDGSAGGLGAQTLFAVALMLLLGVFGKSIVVMRAIRLVERVQAQGLSPAEAASRLEKKGGVSWAAPILALVIGLALTVVLFGGLLLLLLRGAR